MYDIIITEVAERHTEDACFYYEEQQTGLAERFLSELYITYQYIAAHPEYYSFISSDKKFRDIKLKHFPFVVIYEIRHHQVVVIDVFNTHRRPIF
jgi:hypothetical protein